MQGLPDNQPPQIRPHWLITTANYLVKIQSILQRSLIYQSVEGVHGITYRNCVVSVHSRIHPSGISKMKLMLA